MWIKYIDCTGDEQEAFVDGIEVLPSGDLELRWDFTSKKGGHPMEHIEVVPRGWKSLRYARFKRGYLTSRGFDE